MLVQTLLTPAPLRRPQKHSQDDLGLGDSPAPGGEIALCGALKSPDALHVASGQSVLPSPTQGGETWRNPNDVSGTAREGRIRSMSTPVSVYGNAGSFWA